MSLKVSDYQSSYCLAQPFIKKENSLYSSNGKIQRLSEEWQGKVDLPEERAKVDFWENVEKMSEKLVQKRRLPEKVNLEERKRSLDVIKKVEENLTFQALQSEGLGKVVLFLWDLDREIKRSFEDFSLEERICAFRSLKEVLRAVSNFPKLSEQTDIKVCCENLERYKDRLELNIYSSLFSSLNKAAMVASTSPNALSEIKWSPNLCLQAVELLPPGEDVDSVKQSLTQIIELDNYEGHEFREEKALHLKKMEKQLNEKGRVVFRSGQKRHFTVTEIVKQENGKYTINYFNTDNQSENYHPCRRDPKNKRGTNGRPVIKYKPVSYKNVNLSSEDLTVIASHLEQDSGVENFHRFMSRKIENQKFSAGGNHNEEAFSGSGNRWKSRQKVGNCVFASCMAFAKEKLPLEKYLLFKRIIYKTTLREVEELEKNIALCDGLLSLERIENAKEVKRVLEGKLKEGEKFFKRIPQGENPSSSFKEMPQLFPEKQDSLSPKRDSFLNPPTFSSEEVQKKENNEARLSRKIPVRQNSRNPLTFEKKEWKSRTDLRGSNKVEDLLSSIKTRIEQFSHNKPQRIRTRLDRVSRLRRMSYSHSMRNLYRKSLWRENGMRKNIYR